MRRMLRRIKRAIHIATLLVCTSGFTAFAGGKAAEVGSPILNEPVIRQVEERVERINEIDRQYNNLLIEVEDGILQLHHLGDVLEGDD
ncbi:MAG: hypothetical protein AAF633_12135 [Chloroflexota bacterium]